MVVVELVAAHPGPHVPLQPPAVAPRVRHRAAVGAQPSRGREVRTSEFNYTIFNSISLDQVQIISIKNSFGI